MDPAQNWGILKEQQLINLEDSNGNWIAEIRVTQTLDDTVTGIVERENFSPKLKKDLEYLEELVNQQVFLLTDKQGNKLNSYKLRWRETSKAIIELQLFEQKYISFRTDDNLERR